MAFKDWFRVPEPYTPPETRDWGIADPLVGRLFGAESSLSGVTVSDHTAMSLSSVFGCVRLIAGTIATLPLRTVANGARSTSWLDDPGGINGPTSHEFIEYLMTCLLLHGNYYALKVFGGAGQMLHLQGIPPQCVGLDVKNGRKVYRVQLEGGKSVDLTDTEILHIPGLSLDGVRGLSPLAVARNSFGTSLAGDRSAARLFKNGALMSAVVTPTEPMSAEQAEIIRDTLDRVVGGESNAGSMAVFNHALNVSHWSVSPEDAQFLESRKFQLSEIARYYGVPPHLIGDVERSTSWGEGIAEQTLAFQRFTLQPWTSRIEARLSRLLPGDRKVEFDYRQLVAGTPAEEIDLLLKQLAAGALIVDEVREILNRKPLPPESRPDPKPEVPTDE